jgi:hypothetical protein
MAGKKVRTRVLGSGEKCSGRDRPAHQASKFVRTGPIIPKKSPKNTYKVVQLRFSCMYERCWELDMQEQDRIFLSYRGKATHVQLMNARVCAMNSSPSPHGGTGIIDDYGQCLLSVHRLRECAPVLVR